MLHKLGYIRVPRLIVNDRVLDTATASAQSMHANGKHSPLEALKARLGVSGAATICGK